MKKSYEVVWEIFNECANNQMRDIFIEEIETEDTDAWIRSKVKDQELTLICAARRDRMKVFV